MNNAIRLKDMKALIIDDSNNNSKKCRNILEFFGM